MKPNGFFKNRVDYLKIEWIIKKGKKGTKRAVYGSKKSTGFLKNPIMIIIMEMRMGMNMRMYMVMAMVMGMVMGMEKRMRIKDC